MTSVPENWIFPVNTENILSMKKDERDRYFRNLIIELQEMYQQLAQGVNGDIRGDALEQSRRWTPTMNGSTAGTFTYTGGGHQVGWVWRRGIFVDLFFDVQWTAKDMTVAGDLYLELPYEVAKSEERPFVGTLQPSGITYTGGTELVINPNPGTYQGEIWYTGNGTATGKQQVVASGRLAGHLMYMGKANE